jgi:ureidoacrylate peracid hydrolase
MNAMTTSDRSLRLSTQPEPVTIDLDRTAVVVVDMQNAFLSKGGMFDLAGVDISGAPRATAAAVRALAAIRRAGLPVVYLQTGHTADLATAGGPDSPCHEKSTTLRMMRANPEYRAKLLTFGEWDAEIVDAVKPGPKDIVVRKSRYSGFAGTNLDSVLRSRSAKFVFFMGVATNVCVESTIRDAYFNEYWPLLVEDATMQEGPPEIQAASVFNIRRFFGWTTTSAELDRVLGPR